MVQSIFDILNGLGVYLVCDGQTDGRMDRQMSHWTTLRGQKFAIWKDESPCRCCTSCDSIQDSAAAIFTWHTANIDRLILTMFGAVNALFSAHAVWCSLADTWSRC